MTVDFQISHYRVLSRLGEGGMGEVYRGVDQTLRRNVALKAIRADRKLEPVAKARFMREARILSQLDHPNICRVYDYIETADRDWLVLEFIEGETLRAAIKKGLSPSVQLAIAQKIAGVLVATHAAGIVHRDLKPANVMLTASGDVKVLDFGLSATLSSTDVGPRAGRTSELEAAGDEEQTYLPESVDDAAEVSHYMSEAGLVVGTIAYMSPEQARGEGATAASDMYSYGLLLQQLFTGQAPYESAQILTLLDKARRGESRELQGLSSSLTALIKRLKSLAPAQRPTAVDTLERLQWIADAPKRLRRNVAIAALVVAAIFGGLKYTWDLSRERAAALAARDEANQRRGQAEDLIGFMVGDLRTKLAAVGRLEILDEVGKKAMAYFGSVPSEALSDEELFSRSQAMHQLGQVRQARADLAGARAAYDESLAQAEALARRDPDNARWLLGLGTSHFYAGDIRMRQSDLEGGLQHFVRYQDIARQLVAKDPANWEWRRELAFGHSNVAAILSRRGDLTGARTELETTAALWTELVKVRPDDVALQTSRANNYNRLGIVLDQLGDLKGAVEHFERELQIYDTLLQKNVKDARMLRRKEVCRIFLANALRAVGDEDQARRQLDAALQETAGLVKLDPTNADWRRDQAATYSALGRLELEAPAPSAAISRFRDALAIFAPLAASQNITARRDVARAQLGVAEAQVALRQWDAAARELAAADETLRGLNEKDPEVALEFANLDNVRGTIARSRGADELARTAWTRTVDRLTPLAATRTRDRTVLDPLVRALASLGRTEEARKGFNTLSALGYRNRAFLRLWDAH